MIAFTQMVEERDPPRPALKEFVMRYTPVALALSLVPRGGNASALQERLREIRLA